MLDPGTGSERARALAVQADGRLVLAGGRQVVRLNADGTLDPGFGTAGKLSAAIDEVRDIAIASDGKIVLAGRLLQPDSTTSGDFAVARLNPDGSLDTSFGSGGITVTQFPPPGEYLTLEGLAHRVLVQPDGKLLAVGVTATSRETGGLTIRSSALAVARYGADGSIDQTFGSAGRQVVPIGGEYVPANSALARQPDGKVVVGATSLDGDLFLARLQADGATLDLGFNGSGVVRTNLVTTPAGESFDSLNDLAIQNGKIVAAGATRGPGGARSNFALVRYNLDGHLDTGFGAAGKVLTDLGSSDASDATPDDQINRLAIQSSGKIIAAGCTSSAAGCAEAPGDFALAAYNPNGSLDTSFGTGGRVTTSFGSGLDGANDVAIGPDEKLLAAGWANNGLDDDFALARYFAPVPFVAPPVAGKPPAAGTRADTTSPVLSAISLRPRRFRAARSGPSVSAKVGTQISYKLSEPATVKFRVERAAAGRRSGGRCVRARRSNRTARRCTRYVLKRGGFTHKGNAGPNRLRFRGRLGGRRLKSGRYRLRAVAIDAAGNRSARNRKGFRIVRR